MGGPPYKAENGKIDDRLQVKTDFNYLAIRLALGYHD